MKAGADSILIPKISIEAAHSRIRKHIHRTPVLTSAYLNRRFHAEIFLKCENFQKIGAFKFRGALNAVLQLSSDELSRGVVAHSSGNHAQALALAAQLRRTKAFIVMPSTASAVKVEAVKGYGATIISCDPTIESREMAVQTTLRESGGIQVHPFNDLRVIAGQSTAAKELLEDVPNLDYVLAPVGGGGLLSGTALAAHYFAPDTRVFGVEPVAADDAYRSLEKGSIQPAHHPQTIADGLLTSLGEITFELIRKYAEGIVTVTEKSISAAMRLVWERMKIIIEPSAAVPVAALLENKLPSDAERIGIIVSGGNVDLDNLPW